jgi:hypothetical protein
VTLSYTAALANRQQRAVDKYLSTCQSYIDQNFTTELDCENRLDRILKLADKIQKLKPRPDQTDRLWSLVQTGQYLLDQSVHTVRVSNIDSDSDTAELSF